MQSPTVTATTILHSLLSCFLMALIWTLTAGFKYYLKGAEPWITELGN